MAAYKTLNSQDIIVSPLEVTKAFAFSGSGLITTDVNIQRYTGNKFNTTASATFDSITKQFFNWIKSIFTITITSIFFYRATLL